MTTAALLTPAASRAADLDVDAIAAALETARATAKVPGMAVAIVKDDQVLMARGFGVRDVASGAPVTPDTLFQIGSTTKAFTALALEMLAEEPGFGLHDKVRDHLPDFALKDPIATQLATPIDLLLHRSGLPRHDLVWYGSPLSRQDLLARLRYLAPSAEFRETWQYNNLMYLVAGLLVEKLGHTSWEDFVAQRITQPLGMTETTTSGAAFLARPDHATGYSLAGPGKLEALPLRDLTNVAPAGALGSSAHDLARWLRFHLHAGELDGVRLVSAPMHTVGITPQMTWPPLPHGGECALCYPELDFGSYGLAWGTFGYRGERLIWHDGGIDGFLTYVSFMPERGLGVAVVANTSEVELPFIATMAVYDRLLGLTPVDWTARVLAPRPGEPVCDETAAPLTDAATALVGTYRRRPTKMRSSTSRTISCF
jgi:CubicO group peptidase (beta-lactamase class C family)